MRRVTLLGAAAIGAIALAYAMPMQSSGCAQTAHYAAIRAYAAGHPYIDRYAGESCDIVHENGHYYAAKAPAMDFWTVPWYLLLHACGRDPGQSQRRTGLPERDARRLAARALAD